MLFTLLWLGWGVYFVIVEGMALYNSKSGDTLSEHVWAWFGLARSTLTKSVSGWTRVRRTALLAFMVWLLVHFMSGGTIV